MCISSFPRSSRSYMPRPSDVVPVGLEQFSVGLAMLLVLVFMSGPEIGTMLEGSGSPLMDTSVAELLCSASYIAMLIVAQ